MPYLLLLKLYSVLLYTLVHGKALFLNNPALILKSKGAIYISPVDQKKTGSQSLCTTPCGYIRCDRLKKTTINIEKQREWKLNIVIFVCREKKIWTYGKQKRQLPVCHIRTDFHSNPRQQIFDLYIRQRASNKRS